MLSSDTEAGPAFCSFSGGKDSCLALHIARRQGLDVRTLVVVLDETGKRSRSHGIPKHIVEEQARALGLECVMPVAGWKDYELVFVDTLKVLQSRGHRIGIFGDIDLQPHRDWEEKVCAAAGMRALLPLWHRDRSALAREFIALQFRAIVVCVDSRYLGDEFCGREYDAQFLADLPAGVDTCGENGEFHTLVYDGPAFRERVPFEVLSTEAYYAPPEFGGGRYCMARLI